MNTLLIIYTLLFMTLLIAGVTFWGYRVQKHIQKQQAVIKQEIESAMNSMNTIMPDSRNDSTLER